MKNSTGKSLIMNKAFFILLGLMLMADKTDINAVESCPSITHNFCGNHANNSPAFKQLYDAAEAGLYTENCRTWLNCAGSPGLIETEPIHSKTDASQSRLMLELVRSVRSQYWEKIDCYKDNLHQFVQEKYLNKSRHENTEIVEAFGSKFPATSTFLFHYGKKWRENKGRTVILIHGASDNATRAWVAPEMMQGIPETPGLLSALESAGYRVFAITFPHKHGNLFYEAEHIASAVGLARNLTAAEKVTLISHSAGGLAARIYVSNYRLTPGYTLYRGDVEHIITLATPHRGQDFGFRHPEYNYFLMGDEMVANAPMSWDKTLYYGKWLNTFEFSIFSDNFPMQQQVLYDWTYKYPVNFMVSPDWYTTYHGGQGFVSHSMGIKDAVMRGGNFMHNFRNYPVHPDVAVTVIAGNNNRITGVDYTESDGPSDGLVFVESASHAEDLTSPDRREPVRKLIVNENHLTIIYSPAILRLIPSLIK